MLKSYHILWKLAVFFLELFMTSVMVWLDSSVITYFQYCSTESVQHFCYLILICCISISKWRSKSQKRDEGRVRKEYRQVLPAGFTWGGTSPHQRKMLATPPSFHWCERKPERWNRGWTHSQKLPLCLVRPERNVDRPWAGNTRGVKVIKTLRYKEIPYSYVVLTLFWLFPTFPPIRKLRDVWPALRTSRGISPLHVPFCLWDPSLLVCSQ